MTKTEINYFEKLDILNDIIYELSIMDTEDLNFVLSLGIIPMGEIEQEIWKLKQELKNLDITKK